MCLFYTLSIQLNFDYILRPFLGRAATVFKINQNSFILQNSSCSPNAKENEFSIAAGFKIFWHILICSQFDFDIGIGILKLVWTGPIPIIYFGLDSKTCCCCCRCWGFLCLSLSLSQPDALVLMIDTSNNNNKNGISTKSEFFRLPWYYSFFYLEFNGILLDVIQDEPFSKITSIYFKFV